MPQAAASRLHLSEIAPHLVQSEIRSMTVECDRVGGVNLAQGVCDTELPAPVREAAISAIEQGHNIYTRLDGIAPLRAAISRKLAEYNQVHANPDTQVAGDLRRDGRDVCGVSRAVQSGRRGDSV